MRNILAILLLLLSFNSQSETYKDVKLGMCGPIEGMYEYLKESGYEVFPYGFSTVHYPNRKMKWLFAPTVERVSETIRKKHAEGWPPILRDSTEFLVVIHQDKTEKEKGSVCIEEKTVILGANDIKKLSNYFTELAKLIN